MDFPNEGYARHLEEALRAQLGQDGIVADTAASGAGVHWSCRVRVSGVECVTHCFDAGGPEYLTRFRRDGTTVAEGRTNDLSQTVRAVSAWLCTPVVDGLYERYPFVDKCKRSLVKVSEDLATELPAFPTSVTRELHPNGSDIWHMTLSAGDRACVLSFYGRNQFPDAEFTWDGCRLLQFNADDWRSFVRVFDLWVIQRAMPSAIRVAFPGLTFSRAAEFYESGQGIQGEFVESWDGVEKFFSQRSGIGPQIVAFIQALRNRGFDSKFRAGQSLHTLILSRSRRHGLRQGQPYAAFDFYPDATLCLSICGQGGTRKLKLPAAITPALDEELTRLAAGDID